MNKLAIPYDALVFVGDGRKALFLRNDVDEEFPNLKTEQEQALPLFASGLACQMGP